MFDLKETKYGYQSTTPILAGRWIFVLNPKKKYEESGKEYSVELILPKGSQELKDFRKLHEDMVKEAFEKEYKGKKKSFEDYVKSGGTVKNFIKPLLDEEGEETGDFYIQFKRDCQTNDGKPITIPVYDKFGSVLDKDTMLGAGTRLQVAFSIRPYHVPSLGLGASLKLLGVKVEEIAGGGSSGGKLFQFEEKPESDEEEEESLLADF